MNSDSDYSQRSGSPGSTPGRVSSFCGGFGGAASLPFRPLSDIVQITPYRCCAMQCIDLTQMRGRGAVAHGHFAQGMTCPLKAAPRHHPHIRVPPSYLSIHTQLRTPFSFLLSLIVYLYASRTTVQTVVASSAARSARIGWPTTAISHSPHGGGHTSGAVCLRAAHFSSFRHCSLRSAFWRISTRLRPSRE